MSQKYQKLKTLLRELFQLDQPDLDFGIYRILHARSAEISQFLDQDLLPQVREILAQHESAEAAEARAKLQQRIDLRRQLGDDHEQDAEVQRLRALIAAAGVPREQLEAEVYDHLYGFFRRYYSEGDFLSKRVYKPGVYAIPYEGEEVKLHWANADQYYIKTSEYLRDYAFRLRPDDARDPMRVHFRLVDAAEGEHGNVKEAQGKERRFKLASEQPITEEDGELVIRFTYQPDAAKQAELNADAEAMILTRLTGTQDRWANALRMPHLREDGSEGRTRLFTRLEHYAKRNTFDYFIHKDLGGFLRRELDFYIKNEVMHLDDIESQAAPRVEQYLSKIKVIRQIARKVIDFLAQLEDFQKKLWLKSRFVVRSNWLIRLGIIPERFYPAIIANDEQVNEWVSLCRVDYAIADVLMPIFSTPLSIDVLRGFPSLLLDTRHFSSRFIEDVLAAIENIDQIVDGELIAGENHQALRLASSRYGGRIKCVYIDPPYNTGSDGFPYKDCYQHSSWISMIEARLAAARVLMSPDGAIFTSIDDIEQPVLRILFDGIFGARNRIANIVWKGATDNNPTRITTEHEYITCYAADLSSNEPEWRSVVNESKEIMLAEWSRLSKSGASIESIQGQFRKFVKDNRDSLHPLTHYDRVDEDGPYTGSRKVHNPGKEGYRYDVLHPVTRRPCVQPARGYRFPRATMDGLISSGKIIFGEDENQIIQIKEYLRDYTAGFKGLIELDSRVAANALESLFGSREIFRNPKPVELIEKLVGFVAKAGDVVLDFFAGSGTTGQAVIGINRDDGGRRKIVLVEMSDKFDLVLVNRIKKVSYTPAWKEGRPERGPTPEEVDRGPRVIKVLSLESYEDTLNNLDLRRSDRQASLLDLPDARGPDGLKEQYLLRYMLDVESRGSASLLNVHAFTDPTAYKLKVKRPGSDESREVNVDLIETFNWLIGLTVQHYGAPRVFSAEFVRDSEGRLTLQDRLKTDATGPYWLRPVTGTLPDGRKALVVWRKLTGDLERDNLVLDTWFAKQGYSSKDNEFDLIYVNGSCNLENLKTPDDHWKVRLIEEDFHRLMFAEDAL